MRFHYWVPLVLVTSACASPPYEGRWQRVDDTHVLEIRGGDFEFDSPDPNGPFGECTENGDVDVGANNRLRFTYDFSTCTPDRSNAQRIATYTVEGRMLTLDFEMGGSEVFAALTTGEIPRPHETTPPGGGETDHIGTWDAESIDGVPTLESGDSVILTSSPNTFSEEWNTLEEFCRIEGSQMVTAGRMERTVTSSDCSFIIAGADLSGSYTVSGTAGNRRLSFSGDDGTSLVFTGF